MSTKSNLFNRTPVIEHAYTDCACVCARLIRIPEFCSSYFKDRYYRHIGLRLNNVSQWIHNIINDLLECPWIFHEGHRKWCYSCGRNHSPTNTMQPWWIFMFTAMAPVNLDFDIFDQRTGQLIMFHLVSFNIFHVFLSFSVMKLWHEWNKEETSYK